MSQFGSEQPSSGSAGTGLTFVRPLPRSVPAQGADHQRADIPRVPISPREQLQFTSQLFPPRPVDPSDSLPTVTGLELGHFVIEERIGRGGMGAVFRAIDKRLDRVVALKILSPDLSVDPEAVLRFQNEARAAARLDHDNIARVHYIGEEHGLHFIAFEFVTGTNIREFILQKGKLDPESVVNYTLQITEALRHTSAANVVHRDIKPSNIIVSPTGRAKLVDLGLARHQPADRSEDLTVAGTALGTFDYISPEQARDARNVDVRSDIYSLGCTMFHMLTGEPPYPSGTMIQKVLSHHNPTPPEAHLKNPRVSIQLSRVVQKMMASNPDERYASPEALRRDLQQIAENLGMAPSYPEAVVWSTPLFKDRNPYWDGTRTWMAVAIVLLLLVFLVDRLQPPRSTPNSDSRIALANEGLSAPVVSQSQEVSKGTTPDQVNGDEGTKTSSENSIAAVNDQTSVASDANQLQDVAATPFATNEVIGALGNSWPNELIPGGETVWKALSRPTGKGSATDVATTAPVSNQGNTAINTTMPSQDATGLQVESVATAVKSAQFLVTQPKSGEATYVGTLAEAFALATDNSAIEVESSSGVIIQKESIQYADKRIILRAAGDSHPVIRFDLTEELLLRPLASTAAVFDIGHRGALDIYDLDIELVVDSQTLVDDWTIVKLSPGAEFSAQWSSFTMNNPENYSSTFVLLPVSKPSDISNLMPERMTGQPSAIVLKDSICRGQANFVKQRDLHPLDVRIEQSALALSGTLHEINGSEASESMMTTETEPTTTLTLNHVTAILGQGLLSATTGEHGTLEPILVDLRDSILRIQDDDQAVIAVSGNLDSDLLIDKIQWRSLLERNFVQSNGPLFTVESSTEFSFEPQVVSQRDMGASLEQIDDVDLFDRPVMIGTMSLHTVQPAIFTLSKATGIYSNPAIKAASDGRNAGVDWSRSGLPKELPLAGGRLSPNPNGIDDL